MSHPVNMLNSDIEVWVSNKGNEEVHHFMKGRPDLYLFGFNRQLLGEALYHRVVAMVEAELNLRSV